MNYEFRLSPDFIKMAKKLAKRYPSLKDDLIEFRKSLELDPFQGVDLGGGMRKLRMSIKSKGRGKSGGARVISMNVVVSTSDMIIALVYIYDKSEMSSVNEESMRRIIKEMGL